MEYHCGVCIKESKWTAERINSIVVLAGDSHDNKLSFFIKVFEKEEEPKDNVKNIKFGSPVFFTSERENIIELYDIDCLFGQGCNSLKLEGLSLGYNKYYGYLEVRKEDYKRFSCYSWDQSPISELEKKLMNSLYKGRLYESYLDSIPQITASDLQNIILEEEKEIELYDINDLVKELKISYYADHFYIKTDKPESYNLNVTHSFEGTKYENHRFDTYLKQILDLGYHLIGEYDGWFYAKDEAREDVERNTREIPSIKKEMVLKYSKTEHLNYRVRNRLTKYIYPLFKMFFITEKPLNLKKYNFEYGIHGYSFNYFSDDKNYLLSDIRRQNESLRYDRHNKLTGMIYRHIDLNKMLEEWCIPNPIYYKNRG